MRRMFALALFLAAGSLGQKSETDGKAWLNSNTVSYTHLPTTSSKRPPLEM